MPRWCANTGYRQYRQDAAGAQPVIHSKHQSRNAAVRVLLTMTAESSKDIYHYGYALRFVTRSKPDARITNLVTSVELSDVCNLR
jgi:hypothetical protein